MLRVDTDVATIAGIDAVPTILEVVCGTTGMRFAAVARVTEDRWVACAVRDELEFGLKPGGELQIENTLCRDVRSASRAIVIDHVAQDEVFCGHPVPAMYGIQSYISMPISLPDGSFFGTLCALDPTPRQINTPATVGMVRLFAELIGRHLDAHRRLADSEASLLGERRTSELREEFIAVLGHDLRNPLASIEAGAELLATEPQTPAAQRTLLRIHKSVARMTRLIDDVVDFARGRLGGGLILEEVAEVPLAPVLHHVVDELRAAAPDRRIETRIGNLGTLRCDAGRIGQLVSNLTRNALVHGAPDGFIRIEGGIGEAGFELSVTNTGEPIPPETLDQLFKPFVRSSRGASRKGLGLGLYIACEIARAHGGRLDVSSTHDETRFTFRVPHAGQQSSALDSAAAA
jgi:signal transduction histidine kinase